jgi:hypothetical protein
MIAMVICFTVMAALGIGFAMAVRFARLRRDKKHDSY